ncbi:MAG: hypothetical protein J1F09_01065 [Oscillospiraceae bacterium]|nr:hypothetical protein [Oscillospiraceae bacterium]
MANFKNKQSEEILKAIYRNADIAYAASNDVLKRCRNNELAQEINSQKERYKSVASRARSELAKRGEPARQASSYVRNMTRMGIAMRTASDKSSANLAKIMLQGTTMGIVDIQHAVNRSHSAEAPIRESAEQLLRREQDFCDGLKRFL